MRERGINEKTLLTEFNNKIIEFCRSKNRNVIGWNDSLHDDLTVDYICQYWPDAKDNNAQIQKEIKSGRKFILSVESSHFLNYPYAMVPLSNTFYAPMPKAITKAKLADNVLGFEAVLWTEFINTREQLEFHLYPRLAAVAEQAWTSLSESEMKDGDIKNEKIRKQKYIEFLFRLQSFNKILDTFRITHAIMRIADPKDHDYIKLEKTKWLNADQQSEVRQNRESKERADAVDAAKKEKEKREQAAMRQQIIGQSIRKLNLF
jgi:hypothetical protein